MAAEVGVGGQPVGDGDDQSVPARAQARLKRGDVKQHPVAGPRQAGERGVGKGANRGPAHGYHEFGCSVPFSPHRRDSSAPPSDHYGRLAADD
jgi:hypothetical protein